MYIVQPKEKWIKKRERKNPGRVLGDSGEKGGGV